MNSYPASVDNITELVIITKQEIILSSIIR